MRFNADLHIHGRFSAATSADMSFRALARGARQKGVQVVATGDCLHPGWAREIGQMELVDEGTYELDGIRFVLTAEVEAEKRVHHLLLFPDMASAEDFAERIAPHCGDLGADGRPKVWLGGEELAQAAIDAGASIGPAHAFTPWTGMYAHFDSLEHCYGSLSRRIDFLELGLSADTDYGDRIPELAPITFLSNSDAHSPQPVRLAREFNTIEAEDMTYREILMAIRREAGRRFVRNVGLPPEEGKYNRTACSRCFVQYDLERALALRWRCVCGGSIKKGVRDRALELGGPVKHPAHRPEYVYMIPLGQIIMQAIGHSSPFTGGVRDRWEALVAEFGTELGVLLDAPSDRMAAIAGQEVADAVMAFREGRITVLPGGGGRYGSILLPGQERKDTAPEPGKRPQRSLLDF